MMLRSIILLRFIFAQYTEFSGQFNELMADNEASLNAEIQSNPYYVNYLFPNGVPIDTTVYRYSYPDTEDYRIGILIDPCRNLNYDCCTNFFGTPEYCSLKNPGLESERVYRKTVIGNDSEILANCVLVYADSTQVISSTTNVNPSRTADDESYIAEECISAGTPYQYCVGFRHAKKRSTMNTPCSDNNQTLNALSPCYDIYGNISNYCVQIGYTQTAFIPQCSPLYDGDHCGTFLEIHLPYGSPYVDSEVILSSVQLTSSNVSGYYTTTIPLTWLNDTSKVLCAYAETFIRVGSIVYVKDTAPKCCCPGLQTSSRLGGFFCPKSTTGNGPFAARVSSVADKISNDASWLIYPFCQGDLDSPDV